MDQGGKNAHTASRSRTSVTSLEGLLVVTLAEVVSAGVDNDGALNINRQHALQFQKHYKNGGFLRQ